MIYIISPFKTLTNTLLATFIYNDNFPSKDIHDSLTISDEKIGKYIHRSHTDYGLIEKIYNSNEDATIITIIRDPVSQFISGYFEEMDAETVYKDQVQNIMNKPLDDIIKSFNEKDYLTTETYNIDVLFNFYKDIMNFNIYDYRDNHKYFETGFNCYDIKNKNSKNIRLIVIRSDKISVCIVDIGKMFSIDNMKLCNSNVAYKKWYMHLYKDFKNKIYNEKKVEKINEFTSLKYVKYFYNKEEQEKIKNLTFR